MDLHSKGREGRPIPLPRPPGIREPEDRPYPGVIVLAVDATDVQRRIFQVEQVIPVELGTRLTLLYPKWLPGYHAPQAPIELFAGLVITAQDRVLMWRRDPVEVHAFHLEVPDGVDTIRARFQFLSPTSTAQGRVTVTPEMLNLHWNTVLLYPAGHFARQVQVEARLKLPEGWTAFAAIEPGASQDGWIRFPRTSLDVLVDSPVMAGRHVRRIALNASGAVRLNLVADHPDLMALTDEQRSAHAALIEEADALFPSRPFGRYDFLVALSDELGDVGVEHHRCCEIRADPDYFGNWDRKAFSREVMAHEFVHAWNGKFRRGADSWTASFERPIGNSLMWVYEGLTQYWGQVLTARAGLWTPQDFRDALARTAAIYDNRAGRLWRPMSDTTRDPVIAGRAPLPWASWQRSEDYYAEGQLVWLEIDTHIRALTGGDRSLDDFAQAFFDRGDEGVRTSVYDFEDVVRTLSDIVEHDWAALLTERLEARTREAPLGGLKRGGYRLVYRDHPTGFARDMDAAAGVADFNYSLGVTVSADGVVQQVLWDSPAFEAGLTAGSEILAVGGLAYAAQVLDRAIADAARGGGPIELITGSAKRRRVVSISCREGLRHPHLQAIDTDADRLLDRIIEPRRAAARRGG